VIGQAGTGSRVISLLCFPSNQAIFHEDFPGTRAGAIDAMSGPNYLVVLPPVAVHSFPVAVFISNSNVIIAGFFYLIAEIKKFVFGTDGRGADNLIVKT